jgi:hypothetical protein
MDPVKVAGVADWPKPQNKKEVQLFLGFTNFYQQFIQDFSHHAQPLSTSPVKMHHGHGGKHNRQHSMN